MSEALNFFPDGTIYERLMGRWSQRVGLPFLDWLDLPAGLAWLDAGCGTGAFTETLIGKVAPSAVTGIDPSAGQIAYARSRPGTQTATFEVGDGQSLPFGDHSFDVATMALVIVFVPEPAKAVGELARVTRPGGTVATYMWDYEGRGTPLTPILAALESLGTPALRPPSPGAANLDSLQTLWRGAGLADIETRAFRITVSFDSFDEFWSTNAVPAGPHGMLIARMDPEERERLRRRVRDMLPIGADGSIQYEARANAVKGRVAA